MVQKNIKNSKQFQTILRYFIVLLMIPAIYTGFNPGKIVVISAICFGILSATLLYFRKCFHLSNFDGVWAVKILLLYNAITYFRGFSNIVLPSDINALISSLIYISFIVPFFIFLAEPKYIKIIWRSMVTYGLFCCLLCYIYPPTDAFMNFQHNISFVNVFVLCIPCVKYKYKIAILFITLIAVFYDLDRRSIFTCYLAAYLILLCFIFIKNKLALKIIYIVGFLFPITFLFLGVNGSYNIFEQISNNKTQITINDRKINTDSRSSIYKDVFTELRNQNKMIIGLGANGKTKTSLTKIKAFKKIYKYGRNSTESGMLNYIQYGGLIGWLVYTMLFMTCSFYALFRSHNDFCKMLGVYLIFRYIWSYIEDAFGGNAYTFYMYLWFGICLSKQIRVMNNKEIKLFLQSSINFKWK